MPASLQEPVIPVPQELLHFLHQLVRNGAVDHAVILADAQMQHRADGEGVVTFLEGQDNRLLLDSADTQDSQLGLIDNWQTELRSEDAGVGDGERAALNLFWL